MTLIAGIITQGYGAAGSGDAGDPLDTPTLTIEDNADGTGAVATIEDSTTGTTNTVWVVPVGDDEFENAGSRTGDGSVDLDLSRDTYLAYVLSTDGTLVVLSNFVAFQVTGSSPASSGTGSITILSMIRNLPFFALLGGGSFIAPSAPGIEFTITGNRLEYTIG